MFGGIVARCGGCAERTGACSDRVDRLKPNIVISKRGSYQRRGHLTICKVASYRLTLPRTRTRTRQGQPKKYISAQRDMMFLKGGLSCF